MESHIEVLINKISDQSVIELDIIPWSSPIPSFGNPYTAKIATLGLNPSNREFVDTSGIELIGKKRRFHTLNSLKITCWSQAKRKHMNLISDSCCDYFFRNPYDNWFKALDYLISGANASFYGESANACHLDLIPYATSKKWAQLTIVQKRNLLQISGDTLATLLRDTPVQFLVLNGNSVVKTFESISGAKFLIKKMPKWSLPRKTKPEVAGYSYFGKISQISGVRLKHKITVLGFNHNIQSSFGVTSSVKTSINSWIRSMIEKERNEK